MAKHLRTGLEESPNKPALTVLKGKPIVDPLDNETFGKSARQHVREFACVMAILALVIAGAKLMHRTGSAAPYYLIAGALVLLLLGYATPRVLHPVWKGWMAFAVLLGAIMSTVIVSIAWFLMFVPMGIIFKLIGKRVMDLRYKAPVDTYWEERDTKLNDFKLLERQY